MKKIIDNQNELITKKDLFATIKYLAEVMNKGLVKLFKEQIKFIDDKLREVHVDIKNSFAEIKRSNKFLEREIILNRLKIKELEEKLYKFSLPKEKMKN